MNFLIMVLFHFNDVMSINLPESSNCYTKLPKNDSGNFILKVIKAVKAIILVNFSK